MTIKKEAQPAKAGWASKCISACTYLKGISEKQKV